MHIYTLSYAHMHARTQTSYTLMYTLTDLLFFNSTAEGQWYICAIYINNHEAWLYTFLLWTRVDDHAVNGGRKTATGDLSFQLLCRLFHMLQEVLLYNL